MPNPHQSADKRYYAGRAVSPVRPLTDGRKPLAKSAAKAKPAARATARTADDRYYREAGTKPVSAAKSGLAARVLRTSVNRFRVTEPADIDRAVSYMASCKAERLVVDVALSLEARLRLRLDAAVGRGELSRAQRDSLRLVGIRPAAPDTPGAPPAYDAATSQVAVFGGKDRVVTAIITPAPAAPPTQAPAPPLPASVPVPPYSVDDDDSA